MATEFDCNVFKGTTFQGRINQREVYFHVIRMNQAFLLWIGDQSKDFNDLSVAMPPLASGPGASSRLIGVTGMDDVLSQAISQKLAKKTGSQVFVSVNLKHADKTTELELLKRVIEEINLNPEAFKLE